MLHIFNVFRENDGKENCAQLIEEELYKMFDKASSNDEHDCNVASINSLNIHDSSDMQSHKLGDAMFDEDDIFIPRSFDVKFVIMVECLLFKMIIMMNVGLEECQL